MQEVVIPFRSYFRAQLLSGDKTCTSRPQRYGVAGDTFVAFDAQFLIDRVARLTLQHVALLYYAHEGFSSPWQFIKCWKEIHRVKGYTPEQMVYAHFFKRVNPQREMFNCAL